LPFLYPNRAGPAAIPPANDAAAGAVPTTQGEIGAGLGCDVRSPRRPPARAPRAPHRPAVAHPLQEAAIATANRPSSRSYAEEFIAEDPVLATARAKAEELGCVPILPGGGATLRFLAASLQARAVVEVGTGTGVSGVWLLRGMAADGVLTTVDVEAEHQRAARETFAEEGIPANRTRVITGRALDVLPRLTDAVYDLVLVDGDKKEYPDYLEQAHRLLRRGGVVALDNALWHDRVADPAQRDETTVALRELGKALRDDDRFLTALLPVGDGLLVAVKR
jgi:predicted O-methyltransferase YrrM